MMKQVSGAQPLIEMVNIEKVYASNSVKACSNASLRVEAGTIHMVVGENGAGKSTLMKILSGDLRPDAGTISYRGEHVFWRHPDQALDQGIGMIHQILHFFPGLTVREHLMLDMQHIPLFGRLDQKRADRQIEQICTKYHISCEPDELVEHMGSEARQSAALMALISRGTEVFILDEPPRALLEAAKRLQAEGRTVIVITHNMEDALQFGQTVTVLRRGRDAGTFPSGQLTEKRLSELIMGTRGQGLAHRNAGTKRIAAGGELLRLNRVTGGRPGSVDRVEEITLSVSAGETVAVVGIRDNGLRALEALCAGYEEFGYTLTGGEVSVLGKRPQECTFEELGYIPSDRLETGSSVVMSVTDNLIIHDRRSPALQSASPLLRRLSVYSAESLRWLTRRQIAAFGITGEPDHPLITLSGGNIQKLITARALMHTPRVLICADISWGLDVRTRSILFERIHTLKKGGMGVLLFTSEVDVALEEADRIAILRRGSLAGVLANSSKLNPADIGDMML